MKNRTGSTLLALIVMVLTFVSTTQAYEIKGKIQNIFVNSSKKTDTITVRTTHEGKLPRHKYAHLGKMLYVDIYETGGPTIEKKYNAGVVKGVRTSEHTKDGFYRIVVDLKKKTPFTVSSNKNILIIEVAHQASSKKVTIKEKIPKFQPQPVVAIKPPPKKVQSKKRVATPPPLKKKLPVFTKISKKEESPKFQPQPVVAIKPAPKKIPVKKTVAYVPAPATTLPKKKVLLRNTKISLELRDINIATVLKALAKKAGFNIIVSEKIDKKITVSFKKVSAKTAFFSVIASAGYITTKQGEVIIVQTEEEGDRGFQTKVFHIAHADLDEIDSMVKGLLSKEGNIFSDRASRNIFVRDNRSKIIELERWLKLIDTPDRVFTSGQSEVRIFDLKNTDAKKIEELIRTFVSSEGKLSVDSDTNRIIVKDKYKNLQTIAKAIQNLDVSPKQVMVEAAIIEVRLEDETKLGVNWQHISENADSSFKGNIMGFAQDASLATSPTGIFVSASTKKISGILEALNTTTDFNLLAHPKIMALNDQQAEIVVGNRLGFKVVSTSPSGISSESIEFLEVGTKLEFTPHITEDNRITLDLHPEVSEGSISSAGLPIESTSEAHTKISIADGETIIIGGLMKKKIVEIDTQVPILGSIPLIGYFFKKKEKAVLNNEILVFITPTIVKDDQLKKTVLKKEALIEKIEIKEKGF